jgi:effector-binding domain-containing protein
MTKIIFEFDAGKLAECKKTLEVFKPSQPFQRCINMMSRNSLLLFLCFFSIDSLMAYESMFEQTPVGEIKIIGLPERIALEAKSSGPYFQSDNGLFRKLFRYISKNDVAMTTPVEADINPGKMRFFVGAKDRIKNIASTKEVEVRKIAPLKVVAIGVRGSYSIKRFMENKQKLTEWLAKEKKYEVAGDAYAVYWDGPFVLGFFKRSEVHVPIKLRQTDPKAKQ